MSELVSRAELIAAEAERGPWILTQSGRRFHLRWPHADEIHLNDIVWALSHLCRYNGHCREFYSVAQHSVLVSHLVEKSDPALALTALMHDAAEAYTGDITRPMKQVCPSLRVLEEPIERAIADRYLLTWPWPEVVKHADLVLLATERRDLMAAGMISSTVLPDPLPAVVSPWDPAYARARFVMRFNDITGGGDWP